MTRRKGTVADRPAANVTLCLQGDHRAQIVFIVVVALTVVVFPEVEAVGVGEVHQVPAIATMKWTGTAVVRLLALIAEDSWGDAEVTMVVHLIAGHPIISTIRIHLGELLRLDAIRDLEAEVDPSVGAVGPIRAALAGPTPALAVALFPDLR